MACRIHAAAVAPVNVVPPALCWRTDIDKRRAGLHHQSKFEFVEARVESVVRRLPSAMSAPLITFMGRVVWVVAGWKNTMEPYDDDGLDDFMMGFEPYASDRSPDPCGDCDGCVIGSNVYLSVTGLRPSPARATSYDGLVAHELAHAHVNRLRVQEPGAYGTLKQEFRIFRRVNPDLPIRATRGEMTLGMIGRVRTKDERRVWNEALADFVVVSWGLVDEIAALNARHGLEGATWPAPRAGCRALAAHEPHQTAGCRVE
jgi:hypothetical protein